MKLSDLKTGERGVIVKVMGHGGFRKRIVEMGFIKGKVVDVLQNAPLHDPVKYKLMGYEVSLRHSEADMIEVISVEEAERIEKQNKLDQAQRAAAEACSKATDNNPVDTQAYSTSAPLTEGQLRDAAMKKRRTINVALVGNPNCGKTSLFNFASGARTCRQLLGRDGRRQSGTRRIRGLRIQHRRPPRHLFALCLLA